MKHEARLARTATMKYFVLMWQHLIRSRINSLSSFHVLNDFAEDSDAPNLELRALLTKQLFEGTPLINNPLDQELLYGLEEIMHDGIMRCNSLSQTHFRRIVRTNVTDKKTDIEWKKID